MPDGLTAVKNYWRKHLLKRQYAALSLASRPALARLAAETARGGPAALARERLLRLRGVEPRSPAWRAEMMNRYTIVAQYSNTFFK